MTKPKPRPDTSSGKSGKSASGQDDPAPVLVTSLSDDLRTRITDLCTEIESLKSEAKPYLDLAKPFADSMDVLRKELDTVMDKAKLWDVAVPDLKVHVVRTTRKTLKPEKLVDAGVGMDVIEKCYDKTYYCQVKELGKGKEDKP